MKHKKKRTNKKRLPCFSEALADITSRRGSIDLAISHVQERHGSYADLTVARRHAPHNGEIMGTDRRAPSGDSAIQTLPVRRQAPDAPRFTGPCRKTRVSLLNNRVVSKLLLAQHRLVQ